MRTMSRAAVVLFLALSTFGDCRAADPDLFRRDNLVAWCIVPFDAKKRGPQERVEMLARLGFRKYAYDWRAEHLPTFDDELRLLKERGIELTAVWFPTELNADAKTLLALLEKHQVRTQLWVTGGGGPANSPEEQRARVQAEAKRLRPIAEAAARIGCTVGLYNHGGWYGEPENQLEILQELRLPNVGLVYNQHHGHDQVGRFAELLAKMKPHLLALNLNGMVPDGERIGQKIVPLGAGSLDLKLLKVIRESGYAGPIGILGHTQDDAEERLRDNLDGLAWLLRQREGQPPEPLPKYRTYTPPPPPGKVSLVPGKFGSALDARTSGVQFPGREEYRTPPITLELWAKLGNPQPYNILAASEPKSSATHWELFTMAGNGRLTVYVPGCQPDHVRSEKHICDDRWHFLAMVSEPERIRLFVDGEPVADQAVKRTRPAPSAAALPLGIGQLVERGLGCQGLIDDVRLSRGVRDIKTPTAPLERDPQTLELWKFDELAELPAQAAAAPPASKPAKNHWGKEVVGFDWTEQDSVDGRWSQTDVGPFLASLLPLPGVPPVRKGLTIKLGSEPASAVCYDTEHCSWRAAWTGGFLKFDPARYGLIGPPKIDGSLLFAAGEGRGWQVADDPQAQPQHRGVRLTGDRVLIETAIGTTQIREVPGANGALFTRDIEISGPAPPLRMVWGSFREPPRLENGLKIGSATIHVSDPSLVWKIEDQTAALEIPASPQSRRLRITVGEPAGEFAPFDWSVVPQSAQPRWTTALVTRGQRAADTAAYVLDTLALPFDNPYRALFFVSGFDVLPNGDLAVCTAHGDVWLVRGVDERLERLEWRRFATGLFQPLGLKVLDGVIHVLGRDQITRLHDTNRDDEADWYENFCNGYETSFGGHDYVTCLETDDSDNFYFLHARHGVMRVSPDGRTVESIATGFRNPNGMGISPALPLEGAMFFAPPAKGGLGGVPNSLVAEDGRTPPFPPLAGGAKESSPELARGAKSNLFQILSVSPQEGEWTPASSICEVRPGGHYGYGGPRVTPSRPLGYDPPLCWIPRAVDNSSGGQVWAGANWGPLSHTMLHLSFGQCTALPVLRDVADGVPQGATVAWPLSFESGVCRGRVNPHDGHVYVSGLRGWVSSAVQDGSLQRIRYTGLPAGLPVSWKTYVNGIAVRFSEPVAAAVAEDPDNYRVQRWNYRYGQEYGSAEYQDVARGIEGRVEVPVLSATRLPDEATVFLELKNPQPAMQYAVTGKITRADGQPLAFALYPTIHRISADRFPEPQITRRTRPGQLPAELAARLRPGVQLRFQQFDTAAERVGRMAAWHVPADEPPALGFWPGQPFQVRATGWIQTHTRETLRFRVCGEGQVRLRINNRIAWEADGKLDDHPPAEVELSSGYHPFVLEYFSPADGRATARLMWSSDSFAEEPVPPTALWHDSSRDALVNAQRWRDGHWLYRQYRCGNCHADLTRTPPALAEGPDLTHIGRRVTPEWLTRWLRHPRSLRHDAAMPRLFPDTPAGRQAAADVACYLADQPSAGVSASAIAVAAPAAGDALWEDLGCIGCHRFTPPEQSDAFQRLSLAYAAAKFQPGQLVAFLQRPQAHYRGIRMPDFHLSDDEARILAAWIASKATVHIPHDDAWTAASAERGRRWIDALHCRRCHTLNDVPAQTVGRIPLDSESAGNCLAEAATPGGRVPVFDLKPDERAPLRAFLARADPPPFEGTVAVEESAWQMQRLNCRGCHPRDHALSPRGELIAEESDRGIPPEAWPNLTWAGEKLHAHWLRPFLAGELQERPRAWLRGRMPAFPAYADVLTRGLLAEHGWSADSVGGNNLDEWADSGELEIGRRLTLAVGGLDCRQCHGIGGELPTGDERTRLARGIDFLVLRDRMRHDHYLRFVLDPPRFDLATRMPKLAADGRTTKISTVYDGDARRQFEAIWRYLQSLPR